MWDINKDLLANPFDDDLKFLASSFGGLLRTIIVTVDRFGLKARHLRKHKSDVARFYTAIGQRQMASDVAQHYRERILKYRGKLFVFLEHDGVPWNNNNAEHAIKPVAKYRPLLKRAMNRRGVASYLVLLSIYQTCEYRGLSFLDFLRSGQTDIYAFAESRRRRRRRWPTTNRSLASMRGRSEVIRMSAKGVRKLIIEIQTVIVISLASVVPKPKRPAGQFKNDLDRLSAVNGSSVHPVGMPDSACLGAGRVFGRLTVWNHRPQENPTARRSITTFPSVPCRCSGFCSGLNGDSIQFQTDMRRPIGNADYAKPIEFIEAFEAEQTANQRWRLRKARPEPLFR